MKKLLLIFMFLMMFSIVSSAPGTYKLGDDIVLIQTCADCDSVNITSILYPNSTIAIQDTPMTKDGTVYNYTFLGEDAISTGKYTINGVGDADIWTYTFLITPNGEDLDTSEGFVQVGLLALLVLFFAFALVGIIKFENYIGRFTLYWVGHILLIAITFISWNLANDFLVGTPMIAGMFKILFYFFMISAFPMIILSLSWIFYIHTVNEDIKRMMDKGLDEGEAGRRASKRKRKKRW